MGQLTKKSCTLGLDTYSAAAQHGCTNGAGCGIERSAAVGATGYLYKRGVVGVGTATGVPLRKD
jgi:hypothetical protein